ncbi:class I SAM-dependent methyltransferase [Leifsonia sp. NPDC056665]|uniref:class I SAM-dependent methyltransferase n=1 Tax=Leifsonia sp. NPDC056665 TaxID=3345901 RepID=UPI003690233E
MTDDLLAAVRARFDGRAAEYDTSEMHRELAAAAADFADLDGVRDVLDVATGTGLVLRALRERDPALRLSGIDLSGGMVEVARGELPDAVLVEGDATVLPFGDDTFDLVTCVTGLHLFPDPDAAVAEWVRVLRPGGRAVTATFGDIDLSQHGGRHGAEPPPYPTHHERFRTPELLAAAVAPAGLALARHAWWSNGDDRVLLADLLPA